MISRPRLQEALSAFDFPQLFIDELGWDRYTSTIDLTVDETNYQLRAVAEKRGMVAWVCSVASGQTIPSRASRQKLHIQLVRSSREHILIFADDQSREQIWCWARRQTGKPSVLTEHFWRSTAANGAFLQKLEAIAFSLEEEDDLTLVEVTDRARAAFDVDRVTKRFYEQFRAEHQAFLGFVEGISDVADREWYASLMLNRLMFIYFMQRKGFLNGERD